MGGMSGGGGIGGGAMGGPMPPMGSGGMRGPDMSGCTWSGGGPCSCGAPGASSMPAGAPGGLSKDQLQQLMQDEGKLRQFLAENPSMSREVMRMM